MHEATEKRQMSSPMTSSSDSGTCYVTYPTKARDVAIKKSSHICVKYGSGDVYIVGELVKCDLPSN